LRATAVLARVVDEDDGHVELTLQCAQIGEDCGDGPAVVFVATVQPHEGIEE
jgi:hypothetical protein